MVAFFLLAKKIIVMPRKKIIIQSWLENMAFKVYKQPNDLSTIMHISDVISANSVLLLIKIQQGADVGSKQGLQCVWVVQE
jgi:hypothetical protein